ncbi:MAG: HAD family hydrolase [Candidatus Hodarchaeales archaeon]
MERNGLAIAKRVRSPMAVKEHPSKPEDEIRAILFDFGGTLYSVSFDEVELAQNILEKLGKGKYPRDKIGYALSVAEDKLAKHLAAKLTDRLGYVAQSNDWILFNQFMLNELEIDDFDNAISKAMQGQWENFWENMQATETVFSIRQDWQEAFNLLTEYGYRLGMISNTTIDLRPWLKKDKVVPFFDCMLHSYEFGRAKPDASIFHQACAELGLEPRQCAYVGNDYRIDVIGAHSAGLMPILINDGNNLAGIPEKTPFHFNVINSLTEIINLLPLSPS